MSNEFESTLVSAAVAAFGLSDDVKKTVFRVIEVGHAVILPAVRAAVAGASFDESLMIAAERIADARAAEKFSGFKP